MKISNISLRLISKRLLIVSIIIFLEATTSAGVATAKKTIPNDLGSVTNIEVALSVTREAVAQALDSLKTNLIGDTVFVSSQLDNESNWFVESVIIEELVKRGYKVVTPVKPGRVLPSTISTVYVRGLYFKISKLGTSYLRSKRLGLFGEILVVRLVEAQLSFQLVRLPENEVIKVIEVSHSSQDMFPKRMISSVTNDAYPFTKTELKTQSWTRFLQPLIVSSTVGFLIYTFYSNR